MSIKVVASNLVHQIPAEQVYNGGGGGGGSVTVDSELSLSSENPVQNKVIAQAINTITEAINNLTKIYFINSAFDDAKQASVLDKTYNEIKAAFNSGKICYILDVWDGLAGIVTGIPSTGGLKVHANLFIKQTVKNISENNVNVLADCVYTAISADGYPENDWTF